MPYIANRRMNLAGKIYERGEVVPDKVMNDIDPGRQGALTRTRLIIEVETVPKPPGDMCPHCDEGPFQRLAQHISLKHEDILLSDDEVMAEAEQAEAGAEPVAEETDLPEETDGNS